MPSDSGFDDMLGGASTGPQEQKPQMTDFQRDSLRELGNIAAGMATTTLSKFVKAEVKLGVPFMDIVPASSISMFMGGLQEELIVSYAPVSGILNGNVVILFPGKSGLALYDLMLGNKPGTSKALDDVARGRGGKDRTSCR